MRILFEPLAGAIGLGAITRCMALAQQAYMRGHQVAFHAQPYPLLERHPLGERFDAPVPTRPADVSSPETAGFLEAIHIRGLADPAYLRRAVRAELETIERFRPDIVVTEWQPSVPVSARAAGIPFAATLATTELALLVGEPFDPRFGYVNDNVGELCRMFDVPFPGTLEELLHCTSAVNLAPTDVVLEPLLAAIPNTRYVGPLLFPSLELTPAPPFAEKAENHILVYLGLGGIQLRTLLPALAEAFPAPRDAVLVAARESNLDGKDLPLTLGHVTVAHEPGFLRALADTDLVVTRGSQNAVMACLLAGVPVVGVPGTRDSEPLYNMRVLEAHGAGRTLRGMPSADQMAQAAAELTANGAAQRSARLGALLRRHGGTLAAVQALEEVVSG